MSLAHQLYTEDLMRLFHVAYILFLFSAVNAFGDEPIPTNVPSANHKAPGVAAPNVLSPN